MASVPWILEKRVRWKLKEKTKTWYRWTKDLAIPCDGGDKESNPPDKLKKSMVQEKVYSRCTMDFAKVGPVSPARKGKNMVQARKSVSCTMQPIRT